MSDYKTPLVRQFIERGQQIDSYPLADYSLPDLLRSIPVDLAIAAGAFALLFLNRFTRPYTVGGVIMYAVVIL